MLKVGNESGDEMKGYRQQSGELMRKRHEIEGQRFRNDMHFAVWKGVLRARGLITI